MSRDYSIRRFSVSLFFAIEFPSIVGAVLVFVYIWYLDFDYHVLQFKDALERSGIVFQQNLFFAQVISVIIVAVLVDCALIILRTWKMAGRLRRHREGKLSSEEQDSLKGTVLRTGINSIVIIFTSWFIVGILATGLTAYYLSGFEHLSRYILKILLVNTCIGGTVSVVLTFYITDSFLKRYIPHFFPDGDFSRVKGVHVVPIYVKMLASFWFGGLLPVLVFFLVFRSYVGLLKKGIEMADVDLRYSIIVSFVIILSLAITVISSYYFSRTIGRPLVELEKAMKSVKEGDLDVSLQVSHFDEIGNVLSGMNEMVKGLKRAMKDREDLLLMDQELSLAQRVQRSVLTGAAGYGAVRGFDIEVTYLPQNMRVGGDYYHLSEIENGIHTCVIADATGHGIQAALTTMQIDIMNRQSIHLEDPGMRLRSLNERYMGELGGVDLFTSFIVNFSGDGFACASAGHPEQILVRSGGGIVRLKGKGKVIGLSDNAEYEVRHETMAAGDLIILYTDGLFEEFDGKQELFGEGRLEDRIKTAVGMDLHRGPLAGLHRFLINAVEDFLGGVAFQDDITLISIRKK